MNCAGVRWRSGLSGRFSSRRCCICLLPFLGRTDFDAAGDLLRLGPNDRYCQQAVPQRRLLDLNAVREQEAALELPRGDAAMQELTRSLVLLPAAHQKLV